MKILQRSCEDLAAYTNYYQLQSFTPYLRELIERFQIFDRQPSSQSTIALLDSFIWNRSKKRPLFRIDWVNSDDVPLKLTPLLRSHFSTMFYQTRSRVSIRIYSASSFISRFSFKSAHMSHIESTSLIWRSYILSVFSPSECPLVHRKRILFNNEITHPHLNWTRCFFSFKEAAKSSSIWQCSYPFSCMKIPIQWSYTNRKENSDTLDLLCRNLLLKNTKYYANHYYLRFFDMKQQMQILFGRRRLFETPLPTRSCVIHATFTQ